MAYKRFAKKVVRAGIKRFKKRYIGSKSGGLRVGRLAKDVMYLKSVLNPEKKRNQINGTALSVGQVNNNAQGAYTTEITPSPAVGTGYSDRNGASIKLHSSFMEMQFYDQANTASPIKGSIYIVKSLGAPTSAATLFGNMFNQNSFVGGGASIIDYNSTLNPDHFNTYRIIRKINFKHSMDQYSGQKTITNLKIPIKYNRGKGHHVRWDKNTTTVADGNIYMFIVLDNGNIGGSTSTLSNTISTGQYTGLNFNWTLVHYYYDN